MSEIVPEKVQVKLKFKRPVLICFVGIDGAGKSTHARNLLQWMKEHDCRVEYIWNRYDPWILKPVMWIGRKIFLKDQDMFRDYPDYREKKKKILKFPFFNQIFGSIYLAEYVVRTYMKINYLLLTGNSVICDRYYFDIIAGVSADYNYTAKKSLELYRMLNAVLPRPDQIFLIDVPEDIAFKRKDDIPSIEFLTEKRTIYQDLSGPCGMIVINGQNDLSEITMSIRDMILQLM